MNPLENKNTETNPWIAISKNIEKYQKPSLGRSLWQIANTFIPYIGLWILIVYSLSISYWLTAFLILLAAGFLVRLFIIFHDCGHGSYFKSQKVNRFVGMFFGILAFTPYDKWHNQHMRHHGTVGNLDKRGVGDVWTMTKEEYQASDKWSRVKYRIYRNPLVMFGIGSLYVFLIQNRLTKKDMTRKEKLNIYFTNAALLIIFTGMSFAIGFGTFVIIQLSILYIAAISGLWLFYLQHQYEDVTWFRNKEWNYRTVALEGSSFVKFPKLLQWFSGNIGFHHIHHLNARIPNYYLNTCYRENSVFKEVKPVTFMMSLKSLKLRLWDEQIQKMVSFNGRQ
ncbi:MAG: fatty acid desaturase [Prolixibacteraceae bacterium]|nr:fatty acid desaturase [Prolixibacteraceae bacterium]